VSDTGKVLRLAQNNIVVIPFTDRVELGTGLSQLPNRAPGLYDILQNTFTKDLPIFMGEV
jgi:hypothetical protein